MKQDASIKLQDGRALGYAEYGDANGKPILFFHGWPGSRLFLRSLDSLTASCGARVIAPERPGFGLSDFQPSRKITDWVKDVTQLADFLQLDKFAIAGHSGGGPYVAACAALMPERLTVAALIGSFAPLDAPNAMDGMMPANRNMFNLARRLPFLHRIMITMMISGGAERFLQGMLSSLPDVDKNVLASSEKSADDIAQAFRNGVRGPVWDQYILARSWGFDLKSIKMKTYLWQGDQDVMVPYAMGQYFASAIPDCRANFCKGEGHMLIFPRWQEILSVLME